MATVREVLEGLNFEFAHIVVTDYGGGSPVSVIKRFGELEVACSCIRDDILHLQVKNGSN